MEFTVVRPEDLAGVAFKGFKVMDASGNDYGTFASVKEAEEFIEQEREFQALCKNGKWIG